MSQFNFGALERTVEVKIGGDTRRLPMLSINAGRELSEILLSGFQAAEKLGAKDADNNALQIKINDSRNRAVRFLGEHGIPADMVEFMGNYASFEEIVAFATYLRTGLNILDSAPKAAADQKQKKKSAKA